MNRIVVTNYSIPSKKETSMTVVSDIHYSENISDKKLDHLLDSLSKDNPNYVHLVGDIIDSTNTIQDKNERKRLLEFLSDLSSFTKVLYSISGHDYAKGIKVNGKNTWKYFYPEDFYDEVSGISNLEFLNNSSYSDENIFVSAITQPFEYFYESKTEKPLHKTRDNKEIYLRLLEEYQSLLTSPSDDVIKIFHAHSPVHVFDSEIQEKLKDFDYILSGHMHNGMVPPILDDIWRSTRGLIAPCKDLFSINTRNTLNSEQDKVLVNGQITTFGESTGILQAFNAFYPMYYSTLNFNPKNEIFSKTRRLR